MDYDSVVSRLAEDLLWKIAYLSFEVEKGFRRQLVRLSEREKFAAFQRGLDRCIDYAIDRFTDEDFAPVSQKFSDAFATFVAQVGAAKDIAPQEFVFRSGAPAVAADVAVCLLRYEGFRLRPGMTGTAFRNELLRVFDSSESILATHDGIDAAVKSAWLFEGEPDLDAFKPVRNFRQLQGGRLDDLLLSS